jgi:hypothetical protein
MRQGFHGALTVSDERSTPTRSAYATGIRTERNETGATFERVTPEDVETEHQAGRIANDPVPSVPERTLDRAEREAEPVDDGFGQPIAPPVESHTRGPKPEPETRKRRDARQKADLIATRRRREELETRVLGIAASGASLRAIASRLDLSVSYVHEVYHRAMDRVEGEHVAGYRSAVLHRLGIVLQQAWTDAFSREGTPSERSRARRDILAITDQMNRLQGAYPPEQVDIVGEMTVHRELSEAEVLDALAEIQADRILRGEAIVPAGLVLDGVVIEQPALTNGNTGGPGAP